MTDVRYSGHGDLARYRVPDARRGIFHAALTDWGDNPLEPAWMRYGPATRSTRRLATHPEH